MNCCVAVTHQNVRSLETGILGIVGRGEGGGAGLIGFSNSN